MAAWSYRVTCSTATTQAEASVSRRLPRVLGVARDHCLINGCGVPIGSHQRLLPPSHGTGVLGLRCRRLRSAIACAASLSKGGGDNAGSGRMLGKLDTGAGATVASVSQPTPAPAASSSAPIVQPAYPGTPLFWVGVGVALTVVVNWVTKKLYQQAQQAMMRQLMESMKAAGGPPGPFGADPASPFGNMPFPPPPGASPFGPPPSAFQPGVAPPSSRGVVEVAATVVEGNGSASPKKAPPQSAPSGPSATREAPPPPSPAAPPRPLVEPEVREETPPRRSFFQDTDISEETPPSGGYSGGGGYSWTHPGTSSSSSQSAGSGKGKMTVEALEKMLEDPTIQKMIFPYLPEEMRDPATFKWMLQSPIYRSQLEKMLEGTGGTGFDERVVEMMQNFDLSSPEVQAQFSQMGMTPDQVVSRIMADPKLASAFQNPRIQAAILDVASNPYNIAKYSNDAEFMEVFAKMQQAFPVKP